MCGIVGYTGGGNAAEILLHALSGLEYRGYDSAGVALFVPTENGAARLAAVKAAGRLSALREALNARSLAISHCGIGHTRWATHGAPTDQNAHPHGTALVQIVHNGIIENYRELRRELAADGYEFHSDTDTECAALLLDRIYRDCRDPSEALSRLQKRLEGSYALGIVFADRPGELYAARRGSPLIAARTDTGAFIASDIPAILPYTREYCLIEEGETVCLIPGRIRILDADGRPVSRSLRTADWTVEQAQKGGYAHYMLKEICEQPKVLQDTVHPRIVEGFPSFEADSLPPDFFTRFDSIFITACGTAMHAGLLGKELLTRLARIPVQTEIASEFRYGDPLLTSRSLVILVSQSGETADTLAALRLAKERGAMTLSIVNAAGSSMEREADAVLRTYAGPEIAVASTKAYSAQLAVFYLIAIRAALERGVLPAQRCRTLTDELLEVIARTADTLRLSDTIRDYVPMFKYLRDLFFLGRGLDCAVAMEGSLKLKEISYIHCEAYAAGELKHGTISLITDHVPVIAMATQDALLPKMASNIREVRSRGAEVLLVCKEGAPFDASYGHKLELPALDDLFMPLVGVIPLQLIAYHTAVLRGCDVDKPRNLAKSVTVE